MTTHTRKKDEYYTEQGYDLPPSTSLSSYHDNIKEEEKIQERVQEETGVVVQNESYNKLENGNTLRLTNRLHFEEQKVNLGRLPIWFVNALGSMSERELEAFLDEYRDELSVNEVAALNLINGVREGNKDALGIFWNIQLKLLNKTNVINQVNVSINKPDAVVSNLLDEIANKIKNTDA